MIAILHNLLSRLRARRAHRDLTLTVNPETGRLTLSDSLLSHLQAHETGTHILITRLSSEPLMAFFVSPPSVSPECMALLLHDTETGHEYFIPSPPTASAILCHYNLPHDKPAIFTVSPRTTCGINCYTLIPPAK